jgi:hypothetical protein
VIGFASLPCQRQGVGLRLSCTITILHQIEKVTCRYRHCTKRLCIVIAGALAAVPWNRTTDTAYRTVAGIRYSTGIYRALPGAESAP